VELPLTKQILAAECSAAFENKTRPGHQRSCSARHQHLARKGSIGNPTRDLESRAEQAPIANLALAGMNARTDVDADRRGAFRQRVRAADGTRWTLKSRDQAIAGSSRDASTEARYLDRGSFFEGNSSAIEAGLPQP
jgi:hypothetical protein